MTFTTEDGGEVAQALEALREEVSRLAQRVAALEAASTSQAASRSTSESAGVATGGLSEELVLTISAAVAAFLGEKPRIRQIRLLGGASWAQQGRATIQASHSLNVHHG